MKKLKGNEVRQMFLDYFVSKGHMVEPSASLIPVDDPSLLWINAGVAALKKYFDGREKPRSPRITNAQKSIRTNDIENVGKTARHHTFFEMLGNFSIGDYFKKEAIPFAWEFLTSPEWIGFDKDRLYITVYPDDTEAYRIWTEVIGVDPSHILKSPDNFWEIGEGPSGPDTEIYYDRGEKYDPEGRGEELFFKELENDRYIEVWNVVFSQYDAKPGVPRSEYKELPQKNIDTGMGLERLVCLIQDGETNFDTDLFLPLIHAVEKLADKPYSGEYKMAYRVIADHIRTVTFALSDGATFSNEGRGYVLRRVLRRAMRYARKIGIEKPFLSTLVPVVCDINKDFYPYLQEKADFVEKLILKEEHSFLLTLNNGEKLLQEELKKAKETGTLEGEVIFKLYDTYGFPKEMTVEAAEEAGLKVDLEGFEKAMARQKEMARNARGDDTSMHNQSKDLLDLETPFFFSGYSQVEDDSEIVALFRNGVKVESLEEEGEVVFDRSCFYAESGGQIADTGIFENESLKLEVQDVQKAPNGQYLHHVKVLSGTAVVGEKLHGTIDLKRRKRIMANHSSLHLLQSALKTVLGDHVAQAGSYVCDAYGRFDFTHFEKISEADLDQVEKLVNSWIAEAYPVETQVLDLEAAKQTGATALFNEKYGDTVRVVSMGEVSKEFCGGTHVPNTSFLGSFKILSEESIGSGIRRITCCTKLDAYDTVKGEEHYLRSLRDQLDLKSVGGIADRIRLLLEENKALKAENKELLGKLNDAEAQALVASAKTVEDRQYLFVHLKDSKQFLKDYANTVRGKLNNGLVFVLNEQGEKVSFVASVSKAWNEKGVKAGDLVRLACTLCEGKGGGREDNAQGGGKNLANAKEIFAAVEGSLQ
ncbi:MAG: alanine--tRNA ligase [Erysipelotrichaceae bacterium]|nr:alanine--tRNA ligase [Erysipelotrichaceae bacterium]